MIAQILFYYDDKINIDTKSIHLHSYRESMVPNFVRLFVLNRILLLEPNINGSMLTQASKQLKNKEHEIILRDMIKFLYSNGIKSFMNGYYDELKQSYTINFLFDKIIFKLFDRISKSNTLSNQQ